jgi:replication factor C subunit 3/5
MPFLWVDRYTPSSLSKLTLHQQLTVKLTALAHSDEVPHLLFYGPQGVGKKTRVMCLLREIYGPGAEKVKIEHRSFKATSSSKPIEISTIGSNYHIECNPSDAGNNDKYVIQEIIKEIASHTNLSSSIGSNARSFKIVLLTEVDRLSRQAQAGLRRTMEKYSSSCRLILVCNCPSKIIEPVRSRCLGIRVPSATAEEVADLLIQVAKKESLSCPHEVAMRIALLSNRNIRRALLMLETAKMSQMGPSSSQQVTLPSDYVVQMPDWELYTYKIARDILGEQTPSRVIMVRDALYELLTNCIPADVIMSTLLKELLKSLDDSLKHEVTYWAAYYDHRCCKGSKQIFHLEAFVVKFMSLYKQWLVSLFG